MITRLIMLFIGKNKCNLKPLQTSYNHIIYKRYFSGKKCIKSLHKQR